MSFVHPNHQCRSVMEDAAHATMCVSVSDFQANYLSRPADFEEIFPIGTIREISSMFRKHWNLLNAKKSMIDRKAIVETMHGDHASGKDLAKLWVSRRSFPLVLRRALVLTAFP